jgi:hypothetical protein
MRAGLVWLGGLLLALTIAALFAVRGGDRSPTPGRDLTRAGPSPTVPQPAAEPPPVTFADLGTEVGLTVPHQEGADGRFRLIETMGSGAGLLDLDDDGWLDIFVAQGCPLPIEASQASWTARLYHNRRDGTFADVTDTAGVGFNGYGQGVATGDYDGDGHEDLFVSGFGRSALYRNRGDGTFEDATERAGVAGQGWPTSCAFADLDGDGDLDLYVVHYLADTVDAEGRPTINCDALPGRLGYCPPGAFRPEPDVLYCNNGDGTFTDVSQDSGIGRVAGNGLGLAIADWDDDGRLDVFVANDQSPNFLFRNLGNLRFEEVALAWGLAYDESGHARAGMGVAVGDYDGDGRSDILVTNFYEEGDTLYRNIAPGSFRVTTSAARLSVPSRGVLGFGAGFLDADNDGRLDLFTTNGHINDVRPVGMPYAMPPQFFRNRGGGRFADESSRAGPYFAGKWLGRAAAFGDLDNDGATDVLVTHLQRPPALLRNVTPTRGHFLALDLRAEGVGRRAVGMRVAATVGGRTIVRELAGGTSYLGASDPRIIVGIGDAGRVDRLEVRWPSGAARSWSGLNADRFLRIEEGSPEPREVGLSGAAGGRLAVMEPVE